MDGKKQHGQAHINLVIGHNLIEKSVLRGLMAVIAQDPQHKNNEPQVSRNGGRVSGDLSTLILRRGAYSEDVALLQEQLVALKYMKSGDIAGGGLGHYGPKTVAAVRALKEDLNKLLEQKQLPLPVNGIMDPRTRDILNSSIEKYGFNGRNKETLVAHGPAPEPKPAPEPVPAKEPVTASPPKPAPETNPATPPKPASPPQPAPEVHSAPEPVAASEPSPAPEPNPASAPSSKKS